MHYDGIGQSYQPQDTQKHGTPKQHWVRFLLSALLLCATAVIMTVQSPVAEEVARQFRGAVSLDINVDDSLGKTKFIENVFPEAKPVLSGNREVTLVADYAKTGHNGAVFDYPSGASVRAPERGKIVESNEDCIQLLLTDGTVIEYSGCEETPLSEGVDVKRGDILATAGETDIRVKVYRFGTEVDPVAFLNHLASR